jgi:TrmH family RNA methyltransferase
MEHRITSMHNSRIKEAVRLRERRARTESGLFLIEGYRELTRAIDGQIALTSLFVAPDWFLKGNEEALIARAKCSVFECSREVFAKISYRDRPDGLLAIGHQVHRSLASLPRKESADFFLIAERIEKPGNLGTMLRSADGAGVDGVIVADPTTDIYNPNVVRASVGTLFALPVIEAHPEEILAFLQQRGILLVAATPRAAQRYTHVDLTRPLAIAVGAEQYGLSDLWMQRADLHLSIPMRGVADSLNVASAATLLLYEVVRQRQGMDVAHGR